MTSSVAVEDEVAADQPSTSQPPPQEEEEEQLSEDEVSVPGVTIEQDHRVHNSTRYEEMYSWLYYSHAKEGFMCKVCESRFGSGPIPIGSSRGAWRHRGVVFKDNAGKKLRHHHHSDSHNQAVTDLSCR